MPVMLSKRRSLLDLLSTNDAGNSAQPTINLVPSSSHGPERPKSESGFPRSRLSHEVRREDVNEADQDDVRGRTKRFSMLKMRNFSESQLSFRARDAEFKDPASPPPVPPMPFNPSVPAIVKTAPTMHLTESHEEPEAEADQDRERKVRPSLFKRSMSKGRSPDKRPPRKSMDEKRPDKKVSSLRWRKMQGKSTGLEDLQKLSAANARANQLAPPSYGDESNSALALPVPDPRFSESSRSDGSNGSSDQIYGSTTTTTHTVSTHTTFFRLPRFNKNRNSLFPLPVKIPPPDEDSHAQDDPPTPRASTSALSSKSQGATPNGKSPSAPQPQRRHTEDNPVKRPPVPPNAALANSALSFAEPGMNLLRSDSQTSRASSNSSPLKPPVSLAMRERSSTTSSFGRSSRDMGTPPPVPSGRTSTSTAGRSSFGGLLTLSRFRQSSDPHSPGHGSPGARSKSNSFAISREALVVPEREEGDTPGKYLERLEAAVARSMIAGILSKSADPFAQAVLRSYTRRFPFFGEPIDMSLRKFLLEAELPKETQQVDRVIQAFADRYHECNPGIFMSSDQAYIIAFSLMMLHTDAFNKNNKRKMQKHDYIKNTSGQQVSDDVLGCFYDNICYTPFVHYEEEVDINGERMLPFQPKKSKIKGAITDSGKKVTGPVDPYNLLVEQKLDMLRPAIKDTITMDDPYNYRASQAELDPNYLQRAFTHTGVLQIISQRSRPTAYEGQFTNSEAIRPEEMQPGIIDLKITKVGTLWRKAAKKKKARSPWQEWGAVLTGSQLYLFKNAHWAKSLVHQFISAQRHGHPRIPVVFKPPLQEFKPDALIKTDHAVALVDYAYNRHKNAFTFVGPGGQEEVLLADNESELNDWLGLINYAAAFRAAGVRIRGMVGGAEEDPRSREIRRLDSTRSGQSTSGEVAIQNRTLSPQLQRQVMAARRQIMVIKVGEITKEIADASKQLENMMRNARHLLVLAPIPPKSRDDLIHAAARIDAMMKWTRRDIWRMKCHKDILAMDVQQDGVSAGEIETLSSQPVEAPESAKKTGVVRGLLRFNSKAGNTKSSPQSPTSPTFATRPSTTGSLGTYTDDVFKTPPESAAQQGDGVWRLPPLQLDVQPQDPPQDQHRGSVTSTLLSASSQGQTSISRTASTASARRVEQLISNEPSQSSSRGRKTSTPSIADPEVEMLARATMPPERLESSTSRGMNVDGAPMNATPESNKQKSVRRSLQKTLRDAHHPGTVHKHKKGKESDSTVRSASGIVEDNKAQDGTPGLKREKGRFILHGKQASVVQFGGDWAANEKMKARREAWRQNSSNSGTTPRDESTRSPFGYWGARADVLYPMVQDFDRGSDASPPTSSQSQDLVANAEAAEIFARSESPARMDSTSESEAPESSAREYFDAFETRVPGQEDSKRTTVIRAHQRKNSLVKRDDDHIVSASEDEEEDEDDQDTPIATKRQTVIGPSILNGDAANAATNGGAEEDSEDESIDDDEMRHVRPQSRPIEVA